MNFFNINIKMNKNSIACSINYYIKNIKLLNYEYNENDYYSNMIYG